MGELDYTAWSNAVSSALVAIIVALAVPVSGLVGTLIGHVLGQRKIRAESEHLRMDAADSLITQLSLQVTKLTERTGNLEMENRDLRDRVSHLEWVLRRHSIDPDDHDPYAAP